MFDANEIQAWEEEVEARQRARFEKAARRPFDPRKDALNRHRKRDSNHRWCWGEEKSARKMVQTRFRAQMKQLIKHEVYHTPVPHEYKTYGWMTW